MEEAAAAARDKAPARHKMSTPTKVLEVRVAVNPEEDPARSKVALGSAKLDATFPPDPRPRRRTRLLQSLTSKLPFYAYLEVEFIIEIRYSNKTDYLIDLMPGKVTESVREMLEIPNYV